MKKPEIASYGWTGLALGVIAWDILATQTLSSGVDRYLEHPVKRVLAVGAVAITASHLLNILPPKCDPIQQGFNKLGDWYGRL